MGAKAKARKNFMNELNVKNCNDPNWGGVKFPKIRKACSKLEATASENAQDAQTNAIISAATDPSLTGGGAVGETDGATDPGSKSNMPLIIGGVFGALVLATIVIVIIRNRNAAVSPTT